eukprot:1161657-Pelagomonas_calceolata.AAC.6
MNHAMSGPSAGTHTAKPSVHRNFFFWGAQLHVAPAGDTLWIHRTTARGLYTSVGTAARDPSKSYTMNTPSDRAEARTMSGSQSLQGPGHA